MNLTTDRLLLRPFEPTDINKRYLGWLKDPEVTRYSNQRFKTHTHKSCHAFLQSFNNTKNTFLLLEHRIDQVPVGTMTIYRSEHHGTADIGLMLGNKSYWRQGLGLEAWTTVLGALVRESDLRKVTGGTARPNAGMVKIMEQSGMELEAVRHQQELIEGQPVDLLYYSRFTKGMA